MSSSLLGCVVFVMSIFCLVNHKDDDFWRHTWQASALWFWDKLFRFAVYLLRQHSSMTFAMAKGGMKAAPARAMTKGVVADKLATSHALKKSIVPKLLGTLAEVGTAEVN